MSLECDADAAERNAEDLQAEPSYNRNDVRTREVVELSRLPDAQQPCNEEIPAIERADWPGPPHPAAVYPELCMYYFIFCHVPVHGFITSFLRWGLKYCDVYRVSQKSNPPLRLLHIFQLVVILC